AKSQ
ncbi:hypothetical protein BN1723_018307, partial [Verticillium longisporum]